ncbi:hypothetical protein GCM10010168_29430 [Actinoplanes ianthinogenes]|uniref:DUF1203 domain-containing protein n=1 Tax=Actinoplanes ianthinogenes TaxID=122358 RepID=A0ABM7LLK0_9ACTN|nr:DUF1203 domain-containing protein [Actinoplanes ianthinogenes]BCJ40085.1 hypothetical protein Aiant_07420 [Actinoplanes ianthinogenes]GGR10173.1 hypothetical protein GCM10010168_29430 [Actinoplanes ianthinogenes]
MTIEVHAIPAAALEQARADAAGTAGPGFARTVADGGEPLRCCLRDARPGEELLLFTYEPPLPASPYREVGAVFAHAARCAGPDPAGAGGVHPAAWRGRPQVLRAYDERGWIHPATRVHDGSDPDRALAEVFADPAVVQVHSRNVAYGCFMFVATRSSR